MKPSQIVYSSFSKGGARRVEDLSLETPPPCGYSLYERENKKTATVRGKYCQYLIIKSNVEILVFAKHLIVKIFLAPFRRLHRYL